MRTQIIVCNYRTPNDLSEFLASVPESIHTPYVLYVANVEPTEQDICEAKVLRQKDHQIVFEENVGYARAVNYCAAQENTDYLAIFNADVVLTPDSISELLDAMARNPEWGVVGPRQTNERGQLTAAGIFGTNEAPKHRGWLQPDAEQYHDIRTDVVTLAGSALIVRRECWNAMRDCPIFQEVFPGAQGAFGITQHYYEETIFNYHLRSHGYGVAYYGQVGIIHKWHRASEVGGFAERVMPESRQIFTTFCERHGIAHD